MKLLDYPLGHAKFVCYPRRWFLEIHQSISDVDTHSYKRLSKIVMEIASVAEHLDDKIIGHLLSVILWSSYCSGTDAFSDSLKFIFNKTSLFSAFNFKTLKQSGFADLCLKVKPIQQSSYYTANNYLQVVIDLLETLVNQKSLNMDRIFSWRFGSQAKELYSVVKLSNKIFTERKYSLALKYLYESVQSCGNIPVFNEFLLWNVAVILDILGEDVQCTEILEICSETFNKETFVHPVCLDTQKNMYASSKAVLQQLAIRNTGLNCKKYCSLLNEIYLNTSYLSEYYVTICRSDLAYISDDSVSQLQLSAKLQSFDIENILENDSTEQRNPRRLATCCVLLSQSHSYLGKQDLHRGYEYFVLSYNQSNDLESDGLPWFLLVKDRYLAQLHSLEGYFLVLQGKLESAAIAYSKSFSYDTHLVMSLYNQCLLLLKLGKVDQAKRNWNDGCLNVGSHSSDHCFTKLSLYFNSVDQ